MIEDSEVLGYKGRILSGPNRAKLRIGFPGISGPHTQPTERRSSPQNFLKLTFTRALFPAEKLKGKETKPPEGGTTQKRESCLYWLLIIDQTGPTFVSLQAISHFVLHFALSTRDSPSKKARSGKLIKGLHQEGLPFEFEPILRLYRLPPHPPSSIIQPQSQCLPRLQTDRQWPAPLLPRPMALVPQPAAPLQTTTFGVLLHRVGH